MTLSEEERHDLIDALDTAMDDLSYRKPGDFDPEDLPAIEARLTRWSELRTKLTEE